MSKKSRNTGEHHHDDDAATCSVENSNELLERLMAEDAEIRARAVRAICPCRIGWSAYEQGIAEVRRLCKDPSPAVRAAALHVIEDALQMENEGLPTHPGEITNELRAAKRRSRFAADLEAETEHQVSLRRKRDRQRARKHEAGKAFRRSR